MLRQEKPPTNGTAAAAVAAAVAANIESLHSSSKVNLRGLSIITYYSLLTKEIHEFFTNTPKDSWESVNHSLFRIYSNLLRLHSLIEFMPLAQWGYVCRAHTHALAACHSCHSPHESRLATPQCHVASVERVVLAVLLHVAAHGRATASSMDASSHQTG